MAHVVNNLRWLDCVENDKKSDLIFWELIEADEKLLEIASILKLTKEDDRKRAKDLFPIVDYNFQGRI
jgi:hypothetical protein